MRRPTRSPRGRSAVLPSTGLTGGFMVRRRLLREQRRQHSDRSNDGAGEPEQAQPFYFYAQKFGALAGIAILPRDPRRTDHQCGEEEKAQQRREPVRNTLGRDR